MRLMKCVRLGAFSVALLIVAHSSAEAAFKLRITGPDGMGGTTTVTVEDNVTPGGDADDLDPTVGVIGGSFGATFGGIITVGAASVSDADTFALINQFTLAIGPGSNVGTYVIELTDTGFDLVDTTPRFLTSESFRLIAGTSGTFQSWFNSDNGEFSKTGVTFGAKALEMNDINVPSALPTDPFSLTSEMTLSYTGVSIGAAGRTAVTVPEPGTLLLSGIGFPIAGYVTWRRRRKKKAADKNQKG